MVLPRFGRFNFACTPEVHDKAVVIASLFLRRRSQCAQSVQAASISRLRPAENALQQARNIPFILVSARVDEDRGW